MKVSKVNAFFGPCTVMVATTTMMISLHQNHWVAFGVWAAITIATIVLSAYISITEQWLAYYDGQRSAKQ